MDANSYMVVKGLRQSTRSIPQGYNLMSPFKIHFVSNLPKMSFEKL